MSTAVKFTAQTAARDKLTRYFYSFVCDLCNGFLLPFQRNSFVSVRDFVGCFLSELLNMAVNFFGMLVHKVKWIQNLLQKSKDSKQFAAQAEKVLFSSLYLCECDSPFDFIESRGSTSHHRMGLGKTTASYAF